MYTILYSPNDAEDGWIFHCAINFAFYNNINQLQQRQQRER